MADDETRPAVRLRPLDGHGDRSLVRSWLRRPDIEAWWGPISATDAEVSIALASSTAICRMVVVDDVPVGYCHAIDAQVWGDSLPDELEPGTWDLDIFIASETHRGRGVGPQALSLLKDEVFSTTLAVAVCVFASVRNEAAVRAYERAGFKWQRIWHDGVMGPSWFMTARRGVDG
ncbi:MAG: GNAT family N-acetyltransferase [Hyphomicrobium sp.]|nr:GNAT family N-acetyltransferase [Hyphomicrobium sp.]